ncbi:MAG: ComEC/Rec2 family competence protein [Clostridiales bacterium]|nr:ComEC/Rec2 family competence protein [Candidatus Apopatousia equi]
MKNRILNFRPLFFIFVGMMLGIFTAGAFLLEKFNDAIIGISTGFIVIVIATILCFHKRHDKNNKEDKIRTLKGIIIFMLSIILGICLLFGGYGYKQSKAVNYGNTKVEVFGRIENVETNYSNATILLSSVKVEDKDCAFKIKVLMYDYDTVIDNIKIGNYMKFTSKLYGGDFEYNQKFNTGVVNENIYYLCYATSGGTEFFDGKTTIFEDIRLKTENTLYSNMDEENADISMALIFGDKSRIDDEIYEAFSYSGIAHVLSVSGLHITFIVGLLLFFLKKLKVKNLYQFLITALVLILYCTLCGFSPSVVRASLMSLCLMLSLVIGERADTLSSLSLAGIILLLANPFNFYSLGFELSFACVFGILFLSKPIYHLLSKIRIPKVLNGSITITLCATLSTLPIIANSFGFIAPISIISNLIILPIFSVYFCLLFISFLLNLVLPFGFLFKGISYILLLIIMLAKVFSKCPRINLTTFSTTSTILYFAVIFIISKFVKLSKKAKTTISCLLLALIVPFTFVENMPRNFDSESLYIFTETSSIALLTTSNNERYLIGATNDQAEIDSLIKSLESERIFTIDKMIIPNYVDKYQNFACTLSKTFNVKNLVIPDGLENTTYYGLLTNIFNNSIVEKSTFENYKITENFYLDFIIHNDVIKAYEILKTTASQTQNYIIIQGDRFTNNQATTILENYTGTIQKIIFETQTDGIDKLINDENTLQDKVIIKQAFRHLIKIKI